MQTGANFFINPAADPFELIFNFRISKSNYIYSINVKHCRSNDVISLSNLCFMLFSVYFNCKFYTTAIEIGNVCRNNSLPVPVNWMFGKKLIP